MNTSVNLHDEFDAPGVCVIIPTYNNAATIGKVITDVARYTHNIIVVNDGSTDDTLTIVKGFPFVQLLTYPKNVGKGWAIRKGFALATSLHYKFAITIDSDGQHFAKDLPAFTEKLAENPNAIIMGARNMDQASVPGGSSFGNRFSNFWFKLETGISLPDTQSGFRLYPLVPLNDIRFFTVKYEFEIEVLVKAAWKGVDVVSVPVSVYYPPKGERISHFRPYKDFFRISVLNTVLVFITFLYIKPRDFFRRVFIKREFKQMLYEQWYNPQQTDQLKAISIAFGVFMGIVPIWGFQMVAAIFLAILFKLNKPLVIIASNISVPPMIPLIIFGSYKAGAIWMGQNAMHLDFSSELSLDSISRNLQQYMYGSFTLAIVAGALFGLFSFLLLKLLPKNRFLPDKINRTWEKY